MSQKVNVVFIEDHPLMRLGIQQALSNDARINYVGGFASLAELPDDTRIDIVLLDLRLEDDSQPANNVETCLNNGAKVLLYTSAEDPYSVRTACQAGAVGVVRKSDPTSVLIQAIYDIADGKEVAGMDWANALDTDEFFVNEVLTDSERKVLTEYASGLSSYQVARRIGISQHTVNSYVRDIRLKYEASGRRAKSRVDLYMCAVRDSLVPGPNYK
ncbi:MAG: response regulator transcription factor [Actinomycetaceae bacterium]|nr:response regulator transcription factor [Actinomycetaceae bacterium]